MEDKSPERRLSGGSQEWHLEGGEGDNEQGELPIKNEMGLTASKPDHYDKNSEEESSNLMGKATEAEYDAEVEKYSVADKSDAGLMNSA